MRRDNSVKVWLRKKAKKDCAAYLLAGGGLCLLAGVGLFVLFWVVYFIIYIGFSSLVPHDDTTRLWISGAFLALLFLGNALTSRRELETFSFTTGTFHNKPVRVGRGSTINPLAPDSAQSFVKMIASMILIGPRLATAGLRYWARAWRLARLDVDGCAAVLRALADSDDPLPFEELAAVVPEGHDAEAVLRQVMDIEGVRRTGLKPPGLSLYSELRAEIPRSRRKSNA